MNIGIEILEAEGELNKEITSALVKFRQKITEDINKSEESRCKDQYDIAKEGSEKVFRFRESLLSLKFEIADYKTLYNMMAASLLILTFTLVYDNYVTKGSLIDVVAWKDFFRGWERIFLAWWLLAFIHFTVVVIVFVAVKTSAKIWLPLYVLHQLALITVGIKSVVNQPLGFATMLIGLCETIRMVMKSHSYFRTKMLYLTDNPYKSMNPLGPKAKPEAPLNITLSDFFGEVSRLRAFLMFPTLVYRDSYTLTPVRSLSKIMFHLVNFLACIYYAFILYMMGCKQNIENLSKKLDFNTFLLTVIKLMLPSVLFLILGFFGFLHSWLSMWAEITRFPDRGFYSDWWNSIEFGSYYRKWNIVVHDWLYYYVYLDLRRFFPFFQRNKFLAQMCTFMISAAIHEAIMCLALGFFYPILFILFTGPGIILIQNQKKFKKISVNFMFWLEMYIGTALLFSLYLFESFARQVVSDQVVKADFKYLQFLIPRTLYLGRLH